MFVLPNAVSLMKGEELVTFPAGSIFYAGWKWETSVLGFVDNEWKYSNLIFSHLNGRYASAVMYEPGKIMKCGGDSPAKKRTEFIDFTTSGPYEWTSYPETEPYQEYHLKHARRNHTLVILADGKVLAVGGNLQLDYVGPVREAELWDPVTKKWTEMASLTGERMYHSTALLLSEGRVVVAGGQLSSELTNNTAQIFTPPYLMSPHNSRRPIIVSAPNTITYGSNFDIFVDSTQNIEKVAFVGLGAVTHGFDQNQRYVPAANFIANPIQNKLVVPAPANSAVAPPGYYMLFVLRRSINSANGDSQLVPSLAKYVRITE